MSEATGADADSDHYLIIARFALKLSETKRTTNIKLSIKYSIEKLRDEQIHKYYRQTTHDEILKLITESNEENIEHTWKNIQTTVSAGAKKCLGICKSAKKKP
jgi:hypothetical protein